jgi:hypothetical protein
MYSEMERIGKNVVTVYFKHYPRGTEENHEIPQDSHCFKLGTSYMQVTLPAWLTYPRDIRKGNFYKTIDRSE